MRIVIERSCTCCKIGIYLWKIGKTYYYLLPVFLLYSLSVVLVAKFVAKNDFQPIFHPVTQFSIPLLEFPTGVLHAHPGPNIIVAQNWHLVNAYLRFHYVLTTRLFLETCRNSGSKRCRRKKRRARRLCQFHMCAIICLRQLHKRSCFSTCAYAMCRNVLC